MPNILLADMLTDEYLTQQANLIDPIQFNLSKKGLVNFEGINSTEIAIITEDENMQIISAKDLDEQPDMYNLTDANVKRFTAPYLPFETVLRPRDIQNLKPLPGSGQTELEMMEAVVLKRIAKMDMRYAVTFEWILMNMLKGKIMKNASTTLVSLYTLMGKSQKTLDFGLDDDETDVPAKCQELYNMVTDNLNGDISTGVEVQVSPTFFDLLTNHATVKSVLSNYNGNSNRNADTHGNIFELRGVRFERNNTKVGTTKFIDDLTGHAYPVGTIDTFEGLLSPADMMEYVNTEGQRLYVSTANKKHGKGADIHMESRPTAFCKRLDTLVKISTSAPA